MNSDLIILEKFISSHPAQAAAILEHLRIEDVATFIEEIPQNLALQVLNKFELFTATRCLKQLGIEKSAQFLEKISPQVASSFLRQINPDSRIEIFNLVSKDFAALIEKIIKYPVESAGALADPKVLSIPDDITVEQSIKRVQLHKQNTTYYIYVLNREKSIVGVTNLRDLMFSDPGAKISNVMKSKVLSVLPELHYLAVLSHPAWKRYHTLPVVDRSGFFLGVIRYDILRKIEEDSKKTRVPKQAVAASNALGELYQIGLSGLIKSAAKPFSDAAD